MITIPIAASGNVAVMVMLVFLLLLSMSMVDGNEIKGFKFVDNNSTSAYIPENGEIAYELDQILPARMSVCLKVNIFFTRYGSDDALFDITDENGDDFLLLRVWYPFEQAEFNLFFKPDVFWKISPSAEVNILGKWIWLCFGLDFENPGESVMFINGKEIEARVKGANEVPFRPPSQYKLRIGKNSADKRPTIATFLDFNAWNRMLTHKEMELITDCHSSELVQGNLVNSSSIWIRTGSLIEEVTLNISETQCSKEKEEVDLFVPGKWNAFDGAVEVCEKMSTGGMSSSFDNTESFFRVHERARTLSGFVEECWLDGRILAWLPFRALNVESASDRNMYKNYKTGISVPEFFKPPGRAGRTCKLYTLDNQSITKV